MSGHWTPEMDAALKQWWLDQLQSYEIAERLGVSQKSVQGRAQRLGMRFARLKTRRKRPFVPGNHRPADERSAELLRAAGVRI